jgi:WD40 repeat protein
LSNRLLIAPGADGATQTVWDVRTGRKVRTMAPAGFGITALAISPRHDIVVAGGLGLGNCDGVSGGGWDIASGQRRFSFPGCVSDVGVSPNGNFFVAASPNYDAWVYARTGAPITLLQEDRGLTSARFSSDGHLIASTGVTSMSGDHADVARIWDWELGTEIGEIPTGIDAVLSFDPTGPRLVTIGPQGRGEIWDVQPEPGRRVGTVTAWHLRDLRKVATLEGQSGRVSDFQFSPDGKVIAAAGDDGAVHVYNATTGAQQLVLPGSTCGISHVAFSPDSTKLASSSPCGEVRIWALDVNDLLRIARQKVTRSLTTDECRQYLHTDKCPPP